MPATIYRRRLLLCGALLLAFMILSPLAVVGGADLACHGDLGGGCGDVGLLIILFIALPALVVVLLCVVWTAVRRLQWLKLPRWYMAFASLIIIGNIRVVLQAPELFGRFGTPWAAVTTLFLSVFIVVSLLWVPEATDRGPVSTFLPWTVCLLGILQLARLAPMILYPTELLPGGLEMSYAIRGVSYWGPLGLLPDLAVTLAFVAVSLTVIMQWRRSPA
ncbi:hypothetical protein [Rhizobium sp. BK376]|uniref:hypothetical protein n=1 Tax=Rhizobium sp. BK376 TaxID=2512149 RepID=UPI001050DEFE|nr:hypothetical protein [Rhizobium sp. BK376]TCR69297.1 hypothetical protein EV561_14125 [Rhizobium sp. BK376]